MSGSIDRRTFLKGTSAAAALLAAPRLTARAAAQGDRLVVAVGQWGTETPGWERVIHSKGAFNLLLDGAYDEDIDAAMRGFDPERRAKLTQALGQKLYDGYHGVMLGMKSVTWALSRRVKTWSTLAYVPAETNYELAS